MSLFSPRSACRDDAWRTSCCLQLIFLAALLHASLFILLFVATFCCASVPRQFYESLAHCTRDIRRLTRPVH